MAFFSNGQNESSSSGDSSGSGSDSEENRFYKKSANSQRQQSSSTSASSSDSEPDQVSTRPAAEKSAAPPSPKKETKTPPPPKKKPTASDRSAGRNQGTSSEPNPKAPSASKFKRVAAGKRAKDDEAVEEQPEPKKKSASKGNKPVKEEAAPSNPRKKKPRKQQQESAAVVAQATLSAKDSPLKSSKKTAWTDDELTVIMHGYLACTNEGLEFPKNIPQLIEKIKDSLAHEASKTQLYEKLRRMKERYESIKTKMVQGNIKEDVFSYRSSHEKELYQLWKKAWGAQHEGVEMEVEPVRDAMELDRTEAVGVDRRRAGKQQITAEDQSEEDEEEEEEIESKAGTATVKAPKPLVSNHSPDIALVSLTPMPNDKPESRPDYETFMKETRDVMVEVTEVVKKVTEHSEATTRAFLDCLADSAHGTRGAGGGAGRRDNSAMWLRNMELDLEGIYAIREFPSMDEAKVEAMEGKWRELQIRYLELNSQRFALLQEVCVTQIEALKETSGNARSQ